MLKELKVHGFRTLMDTEVSFDPLTIMIGKNGVGKTSILDALQLLGNFARGGTDRAFGPPPWSLSWQRTKGVGRIPSVRFEAKVSLPDDQTYHYTLSLTEHHGEPRASEERLIRERDRRTLAQLEHGRLPESGTILNPGGTSPEAKEVQAVSQVFRSIVSYELNPSIIEQGNDPQHRFIGRDGFGVAGYLANLKDNEPDRFDKLQKRLRAFRPETDSIEVWSGGQGVFWGLRDQGQRFPFPAVHLSWGDRQLVALLCVLFATNQPATTIAVEEIDRGFHPSRYELVINMLSEAAYRGLDGNPPVQIVITTHSPSFLSKLGDRLNEIRMVMRVARGSTHVRRLQELVTDKLGPGQLEQPLGEVWEMGLLEEVVGEALR